MLGAALLEQVKKDLAAAQHDAAHARRIDRVHLVHDGVETTVGEVIQRRGRQLVAQQALRRHHDQRLAQAAHHLPSEHVEHLRRRRRDADLVVHLGRELQEALEARGTVLRPLALVAVRQEQGHSRHPLPLRLAGGDELVDDDLGSVGEVAELALPDDQRGRIGGGVAELEAHHRLLRQDRVDDGEASLLRVQVGERHVALAGLLLVQHRVPVEEGPTARVLAGEAHAVAVRQQRGIGHGLGSAPIERLLAGVHPLAVVDDARHARVQQETVGNGRQLFRQLLQQVRSDGRDDPLVPVRLDVAAPVHGELVARGADERPRLRRALLEALAILAQHRADVVLADHALADERLGIQLARRRMLADHLVHPRLGRGRLVGFVVPVAPVADQVDDDVLVEPHAVVEREARGEHDCLRVVRVHVQDGRLDHLGDVAAVERRAGVERLARGEPDLVVDDEVHGAAGVEAPGLRQLQRLGHHALAGEGGIAVDQHGHDAVAGSIAPPVLSGPDRTLHDRIDDFEVRGIEGQRDVDVAAGRPQVRREALVVLHVARADQVRGVVVPLELREQLLGRLAEDVDQNVQPATVGHADHDLLDLAYPALLDEVVEQRDQGVTALEGKALLADVLCVQVALEALRSGDLPEDVPLLVRRESVVEPALLEAVLQP